MKYSLCSSVAALLEIQYHFRRDIHRTHNLTEKQLQEIDNKTILYSDKDSDGKISYEEFCDVSYSVNTFYTCSCRSLSLPRCLYGSLIKFKGEMWFIEMFLVHVLLFCDAVYMRRDIWLVPSVLHKISSIAHCCLCVLCRLWARWMSRLKWYWISSKAATDEHKLYFTFTSIVRYSFYNVHFPPCKIYQ